PASSTAADHRRLGEKDNAVTWLEKAYEERDPELAWARVEPVWDGLRCEPRFVDLMRRMGFSSILHCSARSRPLGCLLVIWFCVRVMPGGVRRLCRRA